MDYRRDARFRRIQDRANEHSDSHVCVNYTRRGFPGNAPFSTRPRGCIGMTAAGFHVPAVAGKCGCLPGLLAVPRLPQAAPRSASPISAGCSMSSAVKCLIQSVVYLPHFIGRPGRDDVHLSTSRAIRCPHRTPTRRTGRPGLQSASRWRWPSVSETSHQPGTRAGTAQLLLPEQHRDGKPGDERVEGLARPVG